MLSAGFGPTIPARKRPHSHALDRTATRKGPQAYTSTLTDILVKRRA